MGGWINDPFGNRIYVHGTAEEVAHHKRVLERRAFIVNRFLKEKGYTTEDVAAGRVPVEMIMECRALPGWKEASDGKPVTAYEGDGSS